MDHRYGRIVVHDDATLDIKLALIAQALYAKAGEQRDLVFDKFFANGDGAVVRFVRLAADGREVSPPPQAQALPQGLAGEVVTASDMCSGCVRLYATPEHRNPRTDEWDWRRCPTPECRYYNATISYPRDWENLARVRLVELTVVTQNVLRLTRLHSTVLPPDFVTKLLELCASALTDPRTGVCDACEATPSGICWAHLQLQAASDKVTP